MDWREFGYNFCMKMFIEPLDPNYGKDFFDKINIEINHKTLAVAAVIMAVIVFIWITYRQFKLIREDRRYGEKTTWLFDDSFFGIFDDRKKK